MKSFQERLLQEDFSRNDLSTLLLAAGEQRKQLFIP
jgi:hypothetical protein